MTNDQGASPPEGRQDGGLTEVLRRLQWIVDARDDENADLDTICTYAEQAIASLTHSTPVEAERMFGWTLVSDRHINALASALAEIKATDDGKSDQPIKVIVDWCLSEIAASADPIQWPALAAQPLPKQGTGEAHHIDDAELLEETERQVREMLAADPETMAPDTYTGGNFNGVTEGEK